jgi:hypothetical protein
MKIRIDEDMKSIAKSIHEMNLSSEQWAARESDDEFQHGKYCGGYDKDEEAFCFSWWDADGDEFWFQFTLDEARMMIEGTLGELQGMCAE